MAIGDNDYDQARNILAAAGSDTASKSHPKHTQGAGSPESHGRSLLAEARNEFRGTDSGQANLSSGIVRVREALRGT